MSGVFLSNSTYWEIGPTSFIFCPVSQNWSSLHDRLHSSCYRSALCVIENLSARKLKYQSHKSQRTLLQKLQWTVFWTSWFTSGFLCVSHKQRTIKARLSCNIHATPLCVSAFRRCAFKLKENYFRTEVVCHPGRSSSRLVSVWHSACDRSVSLSWAFLERRI